MLWMIICLVMLAAGCVNDNTILVVTSGLYAIAASIGAGSSIIKDAINGKKKEEPEQTVTH